MLLLRLRPGLPRLLLLLVLLLLRPGLRHLRVPLLLLLPGLHRTTAVLHGDSEATLLPEWRLLGSIRLRLAPAATGIAAGWPAGWVHAVVIWALLRLVVRLQRLTQALIVWLWGRSTELLVGATAAATELDAQAGVGGCAADAADSPATRHVGALPAGRE